MAQLIRITAKRDGFRRAGLAHPTYPTEHNAHDFTAEQLAALKAEPMLVVETLPDSKPKQGKGKEDGKPPNPEGDEGLPPVGD